MLRIMASLTRQFSTSALNALSPLDGRYSSQTAPLRTYFSEAALMKYRVKVESQWLLHMLQQGIIPPQKNTPISQTINEMERLVSGFGDESGKRVKEIESTTNHDLKAVEYYIKENISQYKQSIHFCCTSEDINNLSYALMLQDAIGQVITPRLQKVLQGILAKTEQWKGDAMMARTHGQPATPTTLGKEYANFAYRIAKILRGLKRQRVEGKFNGAVGNYNAHLFAFPSLNWPEVSRKFVEKRLQLRFNPYSTQIEPHDSLSRVFEHVANTNTVLIGLCRDTWEYISKGYMVQAVKEGQVGSSTMPHKVNPIDFENCEGNLGVANALADHFRTKLPISRQQRDLSDSTVLRNQGSSLGYCLIGYASLLKGLGKVNSDPLAMRKELSSHHQVITQAIQTELRKVGYPEPYELLKKMSRGLPFTPESKQQLINHIKGQVPDQQISKIQSLTPQTYLGYAQKLAGQARNVCKSLLSDV